MSVRHSGRRGQIKAPLGSTILYTKELLSDSGDHKTFTAAHGVWDQSDPDYPQPLPDGLISGGEITPHTSADTAAVAAGTVSIAGTVVSFSATSKSLTLSDDPDEIVINSIIVDNAGSVTVLAGTQGASGGARGAAGGPPYITVGKVLLAEITCTNVSGVITQNVIDYGAREYNSIPGFTVDHINGKIVYDAAITPIHTGPTARRTYVTYKTMNLVVIGNLTKWSFSTKQKTVEQDAFNDEWAPVEGLVKTWSGSIDGYLVNQFWYDKAVATDSKWFLEFYDDNRATNCWRGFALLDFGTDVDKGANAMNSITVTGSGPIVRSGSFLAGT